MLKSISTIFRVNNLSFLVNKPQFQPLIVTTTIFRQLSSLNSPTPTSSSSDEYRFTLNNANGLLTKQQRDFYEQNGFLVIKKLLPDEDIERYWNRFQDLANGHVKPSFGLVLQKELSLIKQQTKEQTLYKVQELYADEVLFDYCRHPRVLDIVEAFVGSPDILAIHSMLINKPPDTGTKSSRHPLHQDLHYFPLRPADRIVASWTAMEPITKQNGCLSAIPGTHKGQHFEHDYPDWEGGVNKLYYGICNLPQSMLDERIHLEMDRGDCVFFHPLLIHGSGMNRTKGFRKAISCHYASAKYCHYIDVRGTLQDKIAQEILDVFKRKVKKVAGDEAESELLQLEYADLWRNRARLVRGEESNGQ